MSPTHERGGDHGQDKQEDVQPDAAQWGRGRTKNPDGDAVGADDLDL